jgi:hypothetical protein
LLSIFSIFITFALCLKIFRYLNTPQILSIITQIIMIMIVIPILNKAYFLNLDHHFHYPVPVHDVATISPFSMVIVQFPVTALDVDIPTFIFLEMPLLRARL